MTITALSGPVVQFGTTISSTSGTGILGADMEHNEQRAPMVSDLGDSLLDPRAAYNSVGTVDYVPTTVNTSALYTSTGLSSAVVGAAFTLVAASSANGTYSTTIIAPETGKATGTLLAIDSTAAYLTFGSAGTVNLWNPAGGTGRCISITTSSSGDAGTFSIAGRDMYGFKMTETIALSQGTSNSSGITVTSQKAFKYISSITNTTTPTSTGVSIGISDHYGFPLYVPYTGLNAQVELLATSYSSAVLVPLSSANTVLGSTIVTQTSTTPDVRGTYSSTTASNNTVRLQMLVTPTAANIAAITSTNVAPLVGQTQFSSV